jgi:hypothetical protein
MENRDSKGCVPDAASDSGAKREWTINKALAYAQRMRRCIDDLTAKRIACELDPGSGPLHDLAETGAIPPDIDVDLSVAEDVARGLGLDTHPLDCRSAPVLQQSSANQLDAALERFARRRGR